MRRALGTAALAKSAARRPTTNLDSSHLFPPGFLLPAFAAPTSARQFARPAAPSHVDTDQRESLEQYDLSRATKGKGKAACQSSARELDQLNVLSGAGRAVTAGSTVDEGHSSRAREGDAVSRDAVPSMASPTGSRASSSSSSPRVSFTSSPLQPSTSPQDSLARRIRYELDRTEVDEPLGAASDSSKTSGAAFADPPEPPSSLLDVALAPDPHLTSYNLPDSRASFRTWRAYIRALPRDTPISQLVAIRSSLRLGRRVGHPKYMPLLATRSIEMGYDQFALRILRESTMSLFADHRPLADFLPLLEPPIHTLLMRHRWPALLAYTNLALERKVVSPLIIHARLRALYELKRHVDLIHAFDLYRQYNLEPDGEAWDQLARAHLLNVDLPSAQNVLAEKSEQGWRTTRGTCVALLEGMWVFGGNRIMEEKVLNEEKVELLRDGTSLAQDRTVLNRIISARASRGDHVDALKVVDYFQLSQATSDILQELLHPPSTAGAVPDPDASPSLAPPPPLSPSSPHGHARPSPDVATYVILMGLSLRTRQFEVARRLFIDSQRSPSPVPINDHLLAALVRTFLAEGRLDEAEAIVSQLALDGESILADVVCSMKQPPSTMVWECLLGGVLRFRGLKGGAELLERLEKLMHKIWRRFKKRHDGIIVTEGMVATLVEHLALARVDRRGLSADLIVKMYELTANEVRPKIGTLNVLLESAWRRERASSLRARASTRHRRVSPLFPHFLPPPQNSTSSHGVNSPLQRLTTSLHSRQIALDPRQTTLEVLRAASTSFLTVNSMWDYLQSDLLELGIRPTYLHLTIILRAYLRQDDPEGALRSFRHAEEHFGIAPHVAIYSVLISGLDRLGLFDTSRQLYDEMKQRGIKADKELYKALAMGHARQRDPTGVQATIDRAKAVLGDDHWGKTEPAWTTILYRALVGKGKHVEAQEMLRDAMSYQRKGGKSNTVKVDWVIKRVLERTGRWLRWKRNAASQFGGAAAVREWDDRMSKVVHLWRKNLKTVRRRMASEDVAYGGSRELKRIRAVWQRLATGAEAVGEEGGGGSRPTVGRKQRTKAGRRRVAGHKRVTLRRV